MEMNAVHNYYERLVFQAIQENYVNKLDDDTLADMACIALNKIEPRYIRYDIDMSFYMTPSERIEVESKVAKVCEEAYQVILKFKEHESKIAAEDIEHNHGHKG